MPDKLAALKHSYEAAMVRATSPITLTYVQQLQKLKMEYTKAGNLEAALATDALLKETMAAAPGAAGCSIAPWRAAPAGPPSRPCAAWSRRSIPRLEPLGGPG